MFSPLFTLLDDLETVSVTQDLSPFIPFTCVTYLEKAK